jgi:hypothetical protein
MDSVHPLFFSSPCKEQLQEGLLSCMATRGWPKSARCWQGTRDMQKLGTC